MNGRSPANPRQTEAISLRPPATPGFSPHNLESGPNASQPGFTPAAGEGQQQARSRVIAGVLNMARANGAEPASNE